MYIVNWTIVILSLAFPLYVIIRLESIARKLNKQEQRQRELDIKMHNARIIAEQQRSDQNSN